MSQRLSHKGKKSSITQSACLESWPNTFKEYLKLVFDHNRDSYYLREHGLKQNLLSLIGNCNNQRVLDAGSGNGWLLDELKPAEGYACDIVEQPTMSKQWHFDVQDVRNLSYPDNFFDVVVGSLLLMWFEEIDTTLNEMYRVLKDDSKLVISLVHPYFYRMGKAGPQGNFTISKGLSKPFRVAGIKIAGIVGPLMYFYHPFPDYLNGCIKAGFRITKVLDWFIDMKDYETKKTSLRMDSNVPRSGKVPMYSFIECKKE